MNKRINEMIGTGIDLMFLKTDKYFDQVEFRFVWTLNEQFYKTEEYIDIDAKEAVQFCQKLSSRDESGPGE